MEPKKIYSIGQKFLTDNQKRTIEIVNIEFDYKDLDGETPLYRLSISGLGETPLKTAEGIIELCEAW